MATHPDLVRPPAPCPATYQGGVDRWQPDPLNLLKVNQVPWRIIAQIGLDEWTTLAQLAGRYHDAADIDNHAPAELAYADTENHNDAATQRRTTFALKEAIMQAKRIHEQRATATARTEEDPALIMTPGQRESMEAAYRHKFALTRAPPLDEQGADPVSYTHLRAHETREDRVFRIVR